VIEIGHCERCKGVLERGDLRCAICGCAVPIAEDSVEHIEVEILRCEGCGAAVSYDVKAQAPRCSFCDSVMHVEKMEDPMEQTGWWGDFQVEKERAGEALASWFSGLSFLRPSDLRQRASIEHLRPLWWVGWVFDATAEVSWTADSNAGARRSSWAPHSGNTELTFDNILISASRGLTDAEVKVLAPSYGLAGGKETPPPEGSGDVEQFDVQRSEARGKILDAAQALSAARVQAGHIPGSTFRNVNVELVLRGLTTRRCAFPAYVLAYRYRGALYRAVISGHDEGYVTGKAPYSVWKILFLVLGAVALVALLALFVLR
jgi:hypothetical protein